MTRFVMGILGINVGGSGVKGAVVDTDIGDSSQSLLRRASPLCVSCWSEGEVGAVAVVGGEVA
jgi:hypothetical protein